MGNPVEDYVDCYQELASAIVLQAVKDYKSALFLLEDKPKDRAALHDKKSLERFFQAKWYATLTEIDPNRLMSEVQRQVKVEVVVRRKRRTERQRRKEKREMKALLQVLTDAGAVLIPEEIVMLNRGVYS